MGRVGERRGGAGRAKKQHADGPTESSTRPLLHAELHVRAGTSDKKKQGGGGATRGAEKLQHGGRSAWPGTGRG